jgi:hypothetical protein
MFKESEIAGEVGDIIFDELHGQVSLFMNSIDELRRRQQDLLATIVGVFDESAEAQFEEVCKRPSQAATSLMEHPPERRLGAQNHGAHSGLSCEVCIDQRSTAILRKTDRPIKHAGVCSQSKSYCAFR